MRCKFFHSKPEDATRIVCTNNIFLLNPLTLCDTRKYCDNRIISSHYTWWNFIPLNLFEQLHHISNLAFVIIAFLYLFANGTTRFFSVFIPLSFNMFVAMVKDGIYDFARHKQDDALNNKTFDSLEFDSESKYITWRVKRSRDIHVGDIILCRDNDEFPCDMVILASSNTKRKFEITTANLDGETSLKTHYSHKITQEVYFKLSSIDKPVHINSLDWFPRSVVRIECESPTVDLNHFEGKLINQEDESNVGANLSHAILYENIAMRGSKLKNTDFVIGLSVYTGRDTKLSLNSKTSSRKYTSREAMLNVILSIFILVSISLSILLSVGANMWQSAFSNYTWYLVRPKFSAWEFVQNVFTFSFTTNAILPISLIVTLELQQIFLAFFITNDLEMYDYQQQLQTTTKTVHTVDELGQIEFLFSDKTGTLTQNLMELNAVAVFPSNTVYLVKNGHWRTVKHFERKFLESEQLRFPVEHHTTKDKPYTYVTTSRTVPMEMEKLLTIAVLCHTINVKESGGIDYKKESNATSSYPIYQASSPDEKALVEAAASLGVTLVSTHTDEHAEGARQAKVIYRNLDSPQQEDSRCANYVIDAVLEFDSVGKRMSVMVRHPDGSYHIHSKGAETSMLSAESCSRTSSHIQGWALQRVNEFAIHGLRTLVLASRQLDEDEYRQLLHEWNTALQLFGQARKDAIRRARSKIEAGLSLVGVTGVEDKLQPGVPECLLSLREAGIKIWVLTGDKEQTAITVSQAAGHFHQSMSLVRITNCDSLNCTARRLFEILEGLDARMEQRDRFGNSQQQEYCSDRSDYSLSPTTAEIDRILTLATEAELDYRVQDDTAPDSHKADDLAVVFRRIDDLRAKLTSFTNGRRVGNRRTCREMREAIGASGESIGLVIDGQSLTYALGPALRPAFLDLCLNVSAVLCCRMTPLQKASVIQMVHLGLQERDGGRPPVTAAVGDGGNDVAMILQANVGIGIYGREGREAVRAADYALPQFRYLKRLLLVHGHWAHHRITRTMLFFYNKCISFLTVQLWLFVYAGFSAVNWFDTMYFVLYNLTMTSVTYGTFGFFEKHLTANQLLANPHLYAKITRHRSLKAWRVALYVLDGVWQGTVMFFCTYWFLCGGDMYTPGTFTQSVDGKVHLLDFNMIGAATFVIVVICANLRITIYVRDLNVLYLASLLVTIVLNILLFILLQVFASPTSYHYGIYTKLVFCGQFWMSIPLTVFVACLPAIIWRTISDICWMKQLLKNNDLEKSSDDSWTTDSLVINALNQNPDVM